MSAVESRADLPFYLIAAGGQHGVSEAHDGRYESEDVETGQAVPT
jgi:hypothetical protein